MRRTTQERRFTLDGEAVDLEELIDANREGLHPEELDAIRALQPGESITFGGGAWATFMVACVADMERTC